MALCLLLAALSPLASAAIFLPSSAHVPTAIVSGHTSTSDVSAAASSWAALDARLQRMCFPNLHPKEDYLYSTFDRDMNAPCNRYQDVQAQCTFGWRYVPGVHQGGKDANKPPIPIENQRACICNGHFFDLLYGCSQCMRLHGCPETKAVGAGGPFYAAAYVPAMHAEYCNTSHRATKGISAFLASWTPASSIAEGTSTGGVDTLGDRTAVSWYYTNIASGHEWDIKTKAKTKKQPTTTATATAVMSRIPGSGVSLPSPATPVVSIPSSFPTTSLEAPGPSSVSLPLPTSQAPSLPLGSETPFPIPFPSLSSSDITTTITSHITLTRWTTSTSTVHVATTPSFLPTSVLTLVTTVTASPS